MFWLSWMLKFFLHVMLPCSLSTNQTAGRNQLNITGLRPDDIERCICYDTDGKVINPTSLQSTDGKPSFNVSDSKGYFYSYSPCRSFSLGPADRSHCYGDVAVCLWSATSYQNIGRTSSVRCGFEKDYRSPRLEYHNPQYSRHWNVHVILKCEPSITGKARFERLASKDETPGITTRRFLLSHDCLCGDHCPLESNDPPAFSPLKYVGIGAGCAVGVLGIFVGVGVWYRKKKPPPPPGPEGEDCNNADEEQGGMNDHGHRQNANETSPLLGQVGESAQGLNGIDNRPSGDSSIADQRKAQDTKTGHPNYAANV